MNQGISRRVLLQSIAGAPSLAWAARCHGQTAQAVRQEAPLRSAEVIIVPPRSAAEICNEFTGRCIISGVNFYFEPGDRLPVQVPGGVEGVRAIVIEDDEAPASAKTIDQYTAAGARVYRMARDRSASIPNATLAWAGELTFQTICFDAGLTMNHPEFRSSRNERSDDSLLKDLGEQILISESTRWYDAPRYQWESMLDLHEVTRDQRYLETATRQLTHAIEHIPNDLTNCDCVAPMIPMLRLFEITRDQRLLDYAIAKFDEYLKVTPFCEGCLVNFQAYPNNVRSEILWQVLPGMMLLARVSGNRRYAEFAGDQFERLHKLLFDEKQSLWSHGCANGRRTAGYWARGVSFGFLGHLMVLEEMSKDDPRYAFCLKSFQRGAHRLRELQEQLGFWCCVPDQHGSGRESSGTAWICTAMERAMRLGLLDASYRDCAERAWAAVKSRIWQGRYPGHMTATTASIQPEYYLKKQLSETGWAHFAVRPLCERKRSGR